MRSRSVRYFTFVIFSLFCLSGASAQSDDMGPAKPGLNEVATKIIVPGNSGLKWVNTNIAVVSGDTVRLEAVGQVDVGGSWGIHGPEGTTNFSQQPPGYYPLETNLRYGLAGRINPRGGKKPLPAQTWVYGETKDIKVIRSGILYLTVNDDAPDGNIGEFAVTITVVKPVRKAKPEAHQ